MDEFQAQGVHAGSGRERSVNRGTWFGGDMAFAAGEHLLAGQRLPVAGEFGKIGEGVAVLERDDALAARRGNLAGRGVDRAIDQLEVLGTADSKCGDQWRRRRGRR